MPSDNTSDATPKSKPADNNTSVASEEKNNAQMRIDADQLARPEEEISSSRDDKDDDLGDELTPETDPPHQYGSGQARSKKIDDSLRDMKMSGFNLLSGPDPRSRLKSNTEKIVYFFALLCGGTIILLGKVSGWLSPWPAAILAVILITVYATTAWITQRENPVRADRLGDNCYYLGLVYTLASLIASLIIIEQGADVNALLGNFGVALVSTAAGIVARLVMIQLKAEADDVDQRARVALAETAEKMQSDLLSAASTFRSLTITAQETFRVSLQSTEQQFEQSQKVMDKINSLQISPDKLQNSFVGAIERVESASKNIEAATAIIKAHADSLSYAVDSMQTADQSAEHIRDTLSNLASILESLSTSTEKAISSMERQSEVSEAYTSRLERDAEEATAAAKKVYEAMGNLSSFIVDRLGK